MDKNKNTLEKGYFNFKATLFKKLINFYNFELPI